MMPCTGIIPDHNQKQGVLEKTELLEQAIDVIPKGKTHQAE